MGDRISKSLISKDLPTLKMEIAKLEHPFLLRM